VSFEQQVGLLEALRQSQLRLHEFDTAASQPWSGERTPRDFLETKLTDQLRATAQLTREQDFLSAELTKTESAFSHQSVAFTNLKDLLAAERDEAEINGRDSRYELERAASDITQQGAKLDSLRHQLDSAESQKSNLLQQLRDQHEQRSALERRLDQSRDVQRSSEVRAQGLEAALREEQSTSQVRQHESVAAACHLEAVERRLQSSIDTLVAEVTSSESTARILESQLAEERAEHKVAVAAMKARHEDERSHIDSDTRAVRERCEVLESMARDAKEKALQSSHSEQECRAVLQEMQQRVVDTEHRLDRVGRINEDQDALTQTLRQVCLSLSSSSLSLSLFILSLSLFLLSLSLFLLSVCPQLTRPYARM
jgi:chromosome segregation ATPase